MHVNILNQNLIMKVGYMQYPNYTFQYDQGCVINKTEMTVHDREYMKILKITQLLCHSVTPITALLKLLHYYNYNITAITPLTVINPLIQLLQLYHYFNYCITALLHYCNYCITAITTLLHYCNYYIYCINRNTALLH